MNSGLGASESKSTATKHHGLLRSALLSRRRKPKRRRRIGGVRRHACTEMVQFRGCYGMAWSLSAHPEASWREILGILRGGREI